MYQANSTSPLLDGAAKINVQIIDPTGHCLLYEEQQIVNTTATDGRFTIHVGSATGSTKRTVNDPGRSMTQIFQNLASIMANNVPGQTCAGGTYAPSAGAVRYFRLIVTPSTTNIADTLTPDIAIDSVPNAIVAQSVQGLERTSILQTNNSGSTVLTQANLEALFTTPAYTNLQSILGGNFIKTDSSGASMPSYAADPAGASDGDIWFDSTTGQLKYKNSGGVQTIGAGGGGAITSLTMGSSISVNGTVAGTISSGSATIDLSNTGVSAGTYTKVTVDTKGRVTAGTISLTEADIPTLSSAGKVSGNAMTSGTISGSTGINTTGNIITTGTVSGLTVQATNLRVYNGANYIQMTAPALGGNVNLTLPSTDGNANEFLKTDGSGVLSWATATVTSTDVTTALGYTPLNAAATFSGDVSGSYSSISVDKIKGKSVTAATTSGQMMIYNGTAWVNSVVSGDATLAYDGVLTLNKVPVSKGGTNATSFGNNHIIASNSTGTALQDFTCSLNQVISFDASGNAICANVSSLSGAILNGGNTTGADISVGTNDNKALHFKANNTIAMTISQNGSVGFGVTDPGAPVDINSASLPITSTNGILAVSSNDAFGIDKGGTLSFGGTYWAGTGLVSFGIIGGFKENSTSGNDAGYLAFATKSNGVAAAERMRITSAGNVGIGTTAPSSALDVSGAITARGMSSAPSVSAANTGRIYYDYSANKFKVSQNGAAYVDLVSSGGGTGGIISLGGQAGAAQNLAISVDNSVATPTITSASDTHTWKIPMASNAGTTAGLLNKTDYDSFVAKLGAATIFAGDVSGTYNSTVVQKIQGKSVTAASVSGQIMIYDGTAWNNNVVSGDATLAHNGIFTLNKVSVAKGGTNATSFGNNRIIASNGTGTALQDFTCSLNQVITFDASGNSACANVSSLITALVNGGNTTGGTMSVGSNDNHALQFKTNNTIAMTISQSGNVGFGITSPDATVHAIANYTAFRGQVTQSNTNVLYLEGHTNPSIGLKLDNAFGSSNDKFSIRFLANNNNPSEIEFARIAGTQTDNGLATFAGNLTFSTSSGAVMTERMRITEAGTIGVGISTPSANAKLEVAGAAVSRPNIISSGNAVNLSLSNVHVLKSVGSTTIALSNMVSGGSYTLIVSDTTQNTYTFTGCTNTYFSPANGQTYQRSTYSILTVIDAGVTDCYVTWTTGFN